MGYLTYKQKRFWIHDNLNDNMQNLLDKAIPNNWDVFGIVFGREGSGKTTLGTQICYKLDPNFTVKNIVFTPQQFQDQITKAKPETAILWDEAITGANAQKHANVISQNIISRLTMIRKKRLKIIICFPYLYMLNKYFVSRAMFTCFVYAKGFDKRGYGYFFHSTQTELLYNLMKEKYKYNYLLAVKKCPRSFYFKYLNRFCADEKQYEENKDMSTEDLGEENDKWKERFVQASEYIRDETNGSIKKLARKINMNANGIYNIINT